MNALSLQQGIEDLVAHPEHLNEDSNRQIVHEVIAQLDIGALRVCEPHADGWRTHAWIKRAIGMYFQIAEMKVMEVGPHEYFDKIPLKKNLAAQKVRLVPPGAIRYGSFVAPGCVVMPGYVNIGAYVDKGSMVDTWATVGSCAQIGQGVHLSGGVGIGGVLEPAQADPVIIEDHAFIGSRSIVVEGVRVGREAVLGAGVVLTASTPIIDVRGSTEKVLKGHVPPRCVVVPGMRAKTFACGDYMLPCALIIGERSDSTDKKTSLNSVLREFALQV